MVFSGRRFRRLVVALLATGLVAACGGPSAGSGASGPPRSGGTLAIGIESEVDVLDPQRAGGWVSWRVNRQIFEPLVDEDLSKPSAQAPVPPLRPGLASSWEISPDGTVYTFHIREGVKFHDGTPLDAAAVEFNIRRMWDKAFPYYDAKAAGQTTFVWQQLASIATPDPMTVQLTMKQAFQPFLRLLAQGGSGSTGIMSPASVKQYGNDNVGEHPVGTGPFKFVDRVRGQRITLARNDDYWGTKPYLDKVVFRPLPDPSARVASLRADEVDMIAVPPPDSVASLQQSGFQLSEGAPPHVWYLSFNFNDPILKNKLVRQAINLAIDRQGMATNLLKDTVKPAYDVQAPANAAYVENTDAYGYNPDKAKQLLAEAGYPNGFSTQMMTSVDGSGQIIPVPMAEYIQQNLAKVGIQIKLQTSEWISYLSKWAEGTPAGVGWAQQSWGMTTPYWLYIATSSSLKAPNGPNVGGYDNPQLDQVMQQAITATSESAAVEKWKQANRIVTDDAAIAPIVNDKAPYILSPKVHGFVSPSEEWYDLGTVWLS
ncbi:peptide ABC transporter substrate-binding protein [Amycolatopsis alkalitolerans]|uniref:Peptide ABC transporter substrate-binding protein n=1 Tax=Amycolatopsis alkalitolerans TaxID=2547244 RepID=A0A5C4LZY4_9PSEU|nr:peptide ABC transporter substrate-binding protein [Amycolatopsis alkalitolerans]